MNKYQGGQILSRVIGGAGGFLLGGPAGAAIGASTVGPLAADLIFGKGKTETETLYNFSDPSSFDAYSRREVDRVGKTEIENDPNMQFKGTMRTFDALAQTIGPMMGGFNSNKTSADNVEGLNLGSKTGSILGNAFNNKGLKSTGLIQPSSSQLTSGIGEITELERKMGLLTSPLANGEWSMPRLNAYNKSDSWDEKYD